KKKRIEQLRSSWGKQIDKYRNLDLIASYHRMATPAGSELFVDPKTWRDLDFDAIFIRMDRNISGIGQQYLYHLLHQYEQDEAVLKQRSDLTAALKTDRHLRESIQLNLFGLSGVSSYFIANLMLSGNLPHTKFYRLFYLCPILSIASLVMISFNGAFLIAAIVLAITNIILNKIFSHRIYEYFAGFSGLNALIVAALALGEIASAQAVPEIDALKRYRTQLRSLKKKMGYFVIDKTSLPEMAALAIEYLNMFFLFDIVAYYRSADTLLKHREEMHEVFKLVANLDAAAAVASYCEEIPYYATPVFHDKGIGFLDLYHPLIPDAVPNSVDSLSESMLITGSNMSGKTSFIKTIGINVILAQTLHFALARSLTLPQLRVKSSITRAENLEEGKSYFFAEIEAINTLLELSKTAGRYLFLIDEIFRGTNTIERLASSAAVLNHLDAENLVLVTTHDIELQDLLEHTFRMVHFSEQVEDGRFFFNYKIQQGPCSSGNAVRLLEIMNYPSSVVSEARTVVADLLQHASPVRNSKNHRLL
ncbi:MAG TPA: hypothetical protein VK470_03190, partial [Bacteroidota bacterium]|nr:hypothetical protein [Bacteroidota bacterium]